MNYHSVYFAREAMKQYRRCLIAANRPKGLGGSVPSSGFVLAMGLKEICGSAPTTEQQANK